jgi:RNA polymerase sigma-70 factor (ECF subfamily)
MLDFQALLAQHRADVLRHCYRMMGCYADAEDLTQDALLGAWEARESWRSEDSSRSWLLAIATRTCINALERRRPLVLPQFEHPPAPPGTPLEELESSRWITPAPDARLFPDARQLAEGRETVALAFLAMLQRLPALQRAALLLEDVVGLSADELAAALELTSPAVNSALHGARQAMGANAPPPPLPDDPPPEALRAYVRAWEERDLDRLTALLREDVILALPPRAVWFRGRDAVAQLFQRPPFQEFWSSGLRIGLTRANGLPALGFYAGMTEGNLHSIGVTRFEGGQVAEMTVFTGPHFLAGFDLLGAARFSEPSLS